MCKWVNPWDVKSARFAKICPSHTYPKFLFDTYSAQGRMDIAKGLITKRHRKVLKKYPQTLVKVIFACTLCGGCDIMCKRSRDLEILDVLKTLRRKLVVENDGPLPKHLEFAKSIEQNQNPYKEPHKKRLAWLPSDVKLTKGAEIVYFVGCTTSYRRQEIAIATARILNKAGVEFDIFSDEICCGSPALRIGQEEIAKKCIERNIDNFKKKNVKTIVTSCAGCYSMIKVDYPQFQEFNFKIKHSIEFIEELLIKNKLQLKSGEKLKVTYHDPCHLGRLSEPYVPWKGTRGRFGRLDPPKELRRGTFGCYEPPRNVIQKIPNLELVEMERIREYAWCCGAGGGVKAGFSDFSLWVSSERIEEAKATGADVITTCCPFCVTNLSDAIKETKSKLKICDIVELVAKSIEEGDI